MEKISEQAAQDVAMSKLILEGTSLKETANEGDIRRIRSLAK